MKAKQWAKLAAPLLVALAVPVDAVQWAAEAGVGTEYSDNLARSAGDGDGAWVGATWVGMSLYQDQMPLELSAVGELQYETFFDSSQDDELLFSFDGRGRYWIVPGRLSWVAEDYFQQIRIEPLRTQTPANRQNANLFWTGPDLQYEVTPVDTVVLGARYGNVYYEDTPADNDRLQGTARWEHEVSGPLEVSANYQMMSVSYDRETTLFRDGNTTLVTDDFTRSDLFGQAIYASRLWRLQAEAGATRIDRSSLDDVDGALLGGVVIRELPQDSAVGLRIRRQYTDSGANLLAESSLPSLFNLAAASVVQDIIYEERMELFAEYNRDFWFTQAAVYHVDEDFEEVALDRDSTGLSVELGYAPLLTARGSVFFRYEDESYSQIDRDDETYDLGVRARRRLGSSWELGAEVSHAKRDSTDPEFDFSESRALVYLRYGAARPLDPERRRRADFERF